MPKKKEPFATRLKLAREKTGLSQAKFAQEHGINLRTLQAWEIERSAPRGFALFQMERIISEILSK